MCEDALMEFGDLNNLGLNCKFSTMFWGFITYQGTFTEVENNINSRKYINILDTYLFPVIARHFPTSTVSVLR